MVHHYHTSVLTGFLAADEANAWIASYALGNGDCTIVTHERSQPKRKNKIKIPEVCAPFGIPFVNTIEMFRTLGEQF